MNSKLMRPLVALGVVAALALPAAAVAHGGGHGKGAFHGHKGGKGAGHKGGKSAGHKQGKHGRALIVKGTVSAVGTGTIDVLVTGGNHRGRALKGQTVTFDVSNARIVVADVNGDGSRDLADVAVGDRVVVHSRVDKGATVDPSQPLVAKRVVDQGAASTGGSGDTGSGDTGSGDSGDNTGDNSGSTPTP